MMWKLMLLAVLSLFHYGCLSEGNATSFSDQRTNGRTSNFWNTGNSFRESNEEESSTNEQSTTISSDKKTNSTTSNFGDTDNSFRESNEDSTLSLDGGYEIGDETSTESALRSHGTESQVMLLNEQEFSETNNQQNPSFSNSSNTDLRELNFTATKINPSLLDSKLKINISSIDNVNTYISEDAIDKTTVTAGGQNINLTNQNHGSFITEPQRNTSLSEKNIEHRKLFNGKSLELNDSSYEMSFRSGFDYSTQVSHEDFKSTDSVSSDKNLKASTLQGEKLLTLPNVTPLKSLVSGVSDSDEQGRDGTQATVYEEESFTSDWIQDENFESNQSISQDGDKTTKISEISHIRNTSFTEKSVISTQNYESTSLHIFDKFPHHSHSKNFDETTPYILDETGGNFSVPTDTSKITISKNVSDSNILDNEILLSNKLLNKTYKLILKRNCSGDPFLTKNLQILYSIFNSQLKAMNRSKLMKCECVYELNFTSSIVSPKAFKDVINLIKNTVDPDMEVSIVNYDSTVYQINSNVADNDESFIVPKSMVYISSAGTLSLLFLMIFMILCFRNKCRRHSTSLDLSDIPHLTLSVDDYKLAPIPRPSVSFPESNRDFLHAYSNETYSRTRDDETILTHFSNNSEKAYDVVRGQKDSVTQEMKTFTGRRGVSRNRGDLTSLSKHEYISADSWDHLKGKDNGKKHGLDNPCFKKW